jgi:hypothetical protein
MLNLMLSKDGGSTRVDGKGGGAEKPTAASSVMLIYLAGLCNSVPPPFGVLPPFYPSVVAPSTSVFVPSPQAKFFFFFFLT